MVSRKVISSPVVVSIDIVACWFACPEFAAVGSFDGLHEPPTPERSPVKHHAYQQGNQVVHQWHHLPKDQREHKEQRHAADRYPSDPLRKRTAQQRNAKNRQPCLGQHKVEEKGPRRQ